MSIIFQYFYVTELLALLRFIDKIWKQKYEEEKIMEEKIDFLVIVTKQGFLASVTF